jgi:hypothetical protein
VVGGPFGEHDPDQLPFLPSADCVLAGAAPAEAELGLLVHLDLGDHPARRRVQPGATALDHHRRRGHGHKLAADFCCRIHEMALSARSSVRW